MTPDRYWFLTWTTYGTWLPGDERGFVSNVATEDGSGHRVNTLGTEPAAKLRGLNRAARDKMVGPPVYLTRPMAHALFTQFLETSTYRSWQLLAVAVMANHVHLLVGVVGDPEPDALLRDFKSYGSRCLNKQFPHPASTWWTEGGSKRKKTADSVEAAIAYALHQEYPLLTWRAGDVSPLFLESTPETTLPTNTA